MNTYMDALNQQIDRLFDEALGECGTGGEHWVPACNVREDENGFYVQVALPGWEPRAVHANGLLQISFPKREAKARRILIEA